MYGYVRPPLGILKEEETERFRRMYCGSCHTLGRRYGLASRFILNYDFTYLAILNIRVYGTAADVAAIDGSDLTVVADLSDYGSALGTYTVPAVVETSSGSDVGVSGTYEVQITIREPDDQDTAVPEETPAD